MQHYDPRTWSIQHPLAAMFVFFALSGLFLWGNVRVQKAGILDSDVILREDDPFQQMNRYVQDKVHEGFEGREIIPFVINTGVHALKDAEKILQVTRAAQQAFGETVVSLATTPAYHDTGETLLDEPYITKARLAAPQFHIEEWRAQVANDAGVFGLLVGREFSWASVVRYLPPGYDEIAEFRRTVEFLEGRPIPWWEWLWKKDITPQEPWLGVSGWTMGRGLIDQGLNVDILSLVFLGVWLTLPVFWVTLGSGRAALVGVGVMVIGGFVWTRGAMGLIGVPERVFSLLAYASVIVQGTSFALHKFSALAESNADDRVQGWLHARAVDGLLATTALISAFGFATLWSFGLKPIRELGVGASLGVVWLLFMATCVLPACDVLTAPSSLRQKPLSLQTQNRLKGLKRFSTVIDRLAVSCRHGAAWLAAGYRPWAVTVGVCGAFIVAAVVFLQGDIPSYTRALEFIRGTLVEREARILNRPGNVGFEFLDLLVESRRGDTLASPHFLARAWEFQTAVKTLPGSRETSSIIGTVRQIARESFRKPLPETPEEVAAAFFLIENRLAPAVQRQLYFPKGLRIAVSYGTDDSVELGRFRDAILTLAQHAFPDLQVTPFNKVPLYPQVDKYVREGKVSNIFTSQIGVACLCGLLLWRNNRRLRRARLSPVWGGVVMSLPLFFATAIMGLTMWLFHIPLDMATAPIGALAINAATDFSLYMALAYQKLIDKFSPLEALQRTLDAEGRVILTDCLLNTCCFLPLISSHFLPVRQLGWMMGLMLTACAMGSLLFMAALLPRCVMQREGRYEKDVVLVHTGVERFFPVVTRYRSADRARHHHPGAPATSSSC